MPIGRFRLIGRPAAVAAATLADLVPTEIAEAVAGEVIAKKGDIVILGTDGLFDNELERIVRMGTALDFSPKNMSEVNCGRRF